MGGSPTMRKRLFHFSWPWAGVTNCSHYSHPQSKRRSVWAVCCLVSGLLGVTIAIHILLGPITSYRCHGDADAEEFRSQQYTAPNQNQNQSQHRQRVLGFVGIQTGFGSSERRKALRDTWMPSHPDFLLKLQKETGLAFRFVIGRNSDRGKMAEIKKEMRTYKDFLFVDIEEEYKRLPYKTLAFFKAAFKLYDADFYVKVDDDIYLRPDRLATLLSKERSSPRTYIGCMKKGPVFTDPKLKWYEPSGYMLGNEYFLHAYGPIYALSAEVVAGLSVLRNDSFRMFSNEDVTIGAWMLAMNVIHEDNRDICSPICTETSIAVWDIPKCSGLCNPAEQLRELHRKESCYTSLTSQPINT